MLKQIDDFLNTNQVIFNDDLRLTQMVEGIFSKKMIILIILGTEVIVGRFHLCIMRIFELSKS
jgi:hypothetical protein